MHYVKHWRLSTTLKIL